MEFGDSFTVSTRKFLLTDLHGNGTFRRQEHGEEILILDTRASNGEVLRLFNAAQTGPFESAFHFIYGISLGGIWCDRLVAKSPLPDHCMRKAFSVLRKRRSERELVVLRIKLQQFLRRHAIGGKLHRNTIAFTLGQEARLG